MKTKILVVTLSALFSVSAFAGNGVSTLEPSPEDMHKKVELVASYTLAEIEAAPPVTLPGRVQFRWGQLMGWCLASPDCRATLRAEVVRHEGPWADVADTLLPMIDDPAKIAAQQRTWVKD